MFGIAIRAVYPPSAPARLPVSIVSASSLPGSRKCACKSTNPLETMQPEASRCKSPFKFFATSTTKPFSIFTSATC